MRRKILSVLLALILCAGLITPALASSDAANEAAKRLNELGLFQGVGLNAYGTPDFDLDRAPTRVEAITMFVRLLGREVEAQNGTWTTPFTDVPPWAMQYVGYAYANGLTQGTGATTFGSADIATAPQYITFVLRALGYSSDSDFQWNLSWELSDELGFTNGEYNATTQNFKRGDVAIISVNALSAVDKETGKTLSELLIETGAAPRTTNERTETSQQNPTVPSGSGSYIGNINSKKFHKPGCSTLPAERNRVFFDSRESAINAGYTPCGNCQP